MGEEEKEAEVVRVSNEEAGEPFDLRRGPLLRLKVLRLSEEDNLLLMTMHHITSDGWSMGVLRTEMAELYESFRGGVEARLEELPIQYADFAVWQQKWLEGEVLERQLEYWKKQLGESDSA